MNKIYFLSSCDTCRRIISELNLKEKNLVFQDIKTEKITLPQLKELKKLSDSYEALFNKKARKYRPAGELLELSTGYPQGLSACLHRVIHSFPQANLKDRCPSPKLYTF